MPRRQIGTQSLGPNVASAARKSPPGYKRALLDTLSRTFKPGGPATGARHAARDPFDFRAAVVLFSEIAATLPGLIGSEMAKQTHDDHK